MTLAEQWEEDVKDMSLEDFKCKVWQGGQEMLYLTYNFDNDKIRRIVFRDGSQWNNKS